MNAERYLVDHWIKNKVWNRLELPYHQERLRHCAEAVRGGRTFIDVGCGLGHSTAILKRFCPGEWTGFDFYEPAIEKARGLFPDIEFIAPKYIDLGFPGSRDERFELEFLPVQGMHEGVVCSEVIEHVKEAAALVRGLWTITWKKLVVTTPSRAANDPGHLRLYTEDALRELFAVAGVPGVKIERAGRFFYVTAEREG